MNLPIYKKTAPQETSALNYLNTSRLEIENKMRQPQAPHEHKRAEKMLLAVDSAIKIVKKTGLSTLNQTN